MKLNRTEQLPRSKTPVASPRRISSPSMTLPTGVKNLSELTPLQIFQKEFHQLESMITRLRQLHIPNGVDRIFTNFASLKSRYSKFCSNCSVLAKRIALRNTQVEIGPEIKENCRQFTLDFGELLLSFENIDNSMESLYTDHLFMLVKSMATNINKYGAICYSDHRTRSIYQQYESFLKQNLDQAQIDLHDFLQDANFDEITPDKSSHIIERYKQISRKMEIEIPHVMNLQRLVVPNGDSLIKLFHADFVEFIPLLNGIHNFVHEITEIFEKIPSFSTALHNLIESVGLPTSQQQTTPLPSPRATSRSISSMQEFPPHPQDPYDIFIPQICFHLGLEEPSESTNHEDTLQDILNTVKQLQDNHNLEVHKLNTRIEALQDINPTSSLSERNKENREFKEELQKKFNLETERIYRDTLNQIQSLSPVNISSKSDSTKTKIDCIITSVQETLDNQKKTISKLNNEISESKDILSSYREKLIGKDTNSNEHLPNIIENTIQAMENTRRALDQELKNINPTNNTLDEFLHLTLTEYCNYKPQELKNLTNDRMRDMVGRFILDQKEEIKRLKQSLEESNELNKNTNKETINALNQFKTKLEEQLSNTSKTQNTFTDLKKRISELLELHDTKENERFAFRQFLCSFLSQMLHSLKIPQIRFRDASEQQLKAVMSSILEAPEIQQNLVVSSPSSSAQGSRSPFRRNSIIVSQKSEQKEKNYINSSSS
ncbi:hypothetical protein TVAG_390120 [Trichomonas vaginalis G3]|uniref:Uncharacterized protein n=1 Tax=Trichomonas vaginalis (strain ATCC PRA-98 / G3) TaxID=412133 RepID=A2E1B4_TRIV3|nr:hypothetical protein TVAG_390120 [Trichomonas vaginalis G3]|eukprot:XP_001325838.1 hypothetical protein [Trichomonas vaginalis G3]